MFLSVYCLSSGKAFVAKKPAEAREHEQVILEPELEEALKNATDAEMCDIAGWGNIFIRSDLYTEVDVRFRRRNS